MALLSRIDVGNLNATFITPVLGQAEGDHNLLSRKYGFVFDPSLTVRSLA
jgi:hypothetical protein